ncbi:anti-dorsalizing morphogenic protein [Nematolebias whitei]|uniref:anti-dorsalizing morphogenic protein n=1 Tax=Nematolebias whitei TaxID=451745 RepID=UPI00189772AE|nr:anti-dorsalizing morphogenic protein [Nematolebias whitei]
MLVFVIRLVLVLRVTSAWPSLGSQDNHFISGNETEEVRSAAIKRLLEVFGMEDPPAVHGHKQPPQYMLDLYNTVADVDGVTKDPYVLEGNTVRSFFDKLHSEQVEFRFNLSVVARTEKVLTAELHLFKLRPQVTLTPSRHHFCQVSVYQLLDSSTTSKQGRKLLSFRLVPVHSTGWEVFTITQAVSSWMQDEGSNLGLHVVVRCLGGSQVDLNLIRFASGRHHHQSKQPMLVLFTDDGRRSATLESTNPHEVISTSILPQIPTSASPPRSARSLDHIDEEGRLKPCQHLPLYVDFEEIGWSGWIVSPKGYNAYHCKGSCSFPLGQNMRPTNHATVQSIINALKLIRGIQTPCCVPDKLFSINLLYFDEDENVVLKQYNDMVAGSCGCH